MNVIISGCRHFSDFILLKNVCNFIIDKYQLKIKNILSGRQRGADKLGEMFAREKHYPIIPFPPDWDRHGKAAGPIRNEEMARNADVLICFWDGKSKGTRNMIDNAKRYDLKVHVFRIDKFEKSKNNG